MGLSDFWLQFNNGKKEQLSDIRGDIRRETIDKKYYNIFDLFDLNKNGALEGDEAEIFTQIVTNLSNDKTLTSQEANSIFKRLGIENTDGIDFLDFVKNLFDANKRIKSTDESYLPDGSRKVVTEYENGSRLTAVYYSDGGLKYKISEIPSVSSNNSVLVSSSNSRRGIELGLSATSGNQVGNTNTGMLRKSEFSDRAKAELKQQFGEHFQEVANNILSIIDSFNEDMTVWDRSGVDARQAWVDKNPVELYTSEGIKKLEELKEQAEGNSELAKKLMEVLETHPDLFDFRIQQDFGISSFDYEKMENFNQTSTKYLNAKSLKQRIDTLNAGIKEVKRLYENAKTKQRGIPNSDKLNSDYDKKFMKVLTEYFNGDEGVAAAFFETMKEGLQTGTKEEITSSDILFTILDRIQKATQKTYSDVLVGEKFENLEARYKAEFKEIYGREDKTTDVENIIQSGQAVGGTIKIGAMTTVQILLSAMTMGTGNAALIAFMSNPLVGYLTTVGTDYALSIAGALTSQTGLTTEKHAQILEGTAETAKFIGVGTLSAPLCKFVGQTLSKYTGKIFENGVKTTTGNITKSTVSGENFLENICTKSANLAGSFGTELGVFTGYEVATSDEDFDKAFGSQKDMLSQLKVVNKFLQVALGKFVRAQSAKGQEKLVMAEYRKFLKDTGLDNASIIKHETPTGTRYTGEINGVKFTGQTEEEIQGKLMFFAAAIGLKQTKVAETGVNIGVNKVVNKEVNNEIKAEENVENHNYQINDKIDTAEKYYKQNNIQLPPYLKLGNKVFTLNPERGINNNYNLEEIRTELEQLKETNPEKAEELSVVLDMMVNPTPADKVSDNQINAIVNYLNDHYDVTKNYLTEQADKIGISDPNLGKFGNRIKGEWSTRDKIVNYINNAKEKGLAKTLLDAYNDVRDKYASRTVFKKGDYTKHPEVVKILEEGNYSPEAYRKAELRAAELQSQPAVDMIIKAMHKAVEEGKDLSMMRISNYTSENGIPIFSELQLETIKLEGAKLGINVEFIKLAKDIDPRGTVTEEEYQKQKDELTTKAQPSGYTALQINFVTRTGEVIEWQYRGELVNIFAEAEHLPYDLRTGKHPWNQYPELKILFKPIADLLDESTMPKHAYKQLNKYFTDYYTHLRRLELGFESKEPQLQDYEKYADKDGVYHEYKFDKRLEAKNLIMLHDYSEGILGGLITPERALEEYNAAVGFKTQGAQKANKNAGKVLEMFNSKEGLKDIKENINAQIASLVENSNPEIREEVVNLIYRLKNAKERWGAKTQEYSDEQLLQIISVASNPDGTLNLTVLQRICKRMDGGPREDNSKITRILPMDTKEHNLARRSDGFYDEDLVEIGKKLMYAHGTREEIFKLLKDENGNPINDLVKLLKTDNKENFDDGETILNVLKVLYTDGKLDQNKLALMKELVKDGVTIYRAANVMQSGMPADIVKNMGTLNQKGLSNDDINNVINYLKSKNIEPTYENVKNTIENCSEIPELRDVHIKHLFNLRGETINQSVYNNVLYSSERVNEYYKRHPELADKKPDLVSQFVKLLYIEGRTKQFTQSEILDLLSDDSQGRPVYDIDKLVESGVLRDIPGRSKPLSKSDLLRLQKEDIEVLKKAVEKGLLSDEYMRLCNLTWKKHVMVIGGKSKLQRLTELSDTELNNLMNMDWSDLDFSTAISLAKCDPKKVDFVLDVMNIYTVPDYHKILLRDYNLDLAYKLFKEIDPHTTYPDSDIGVKVDGIIGILYVAKPHNINEINYMVDNRTELGITASQIKNLVSNEIKAKDIRRLAKKIGKENISKIDERALPVAIKFVDFYKVKDINELSAVQKRKLRIKLTECNGDLFAPKVQDLKELFPLIPKDQTEYCSTMRDIVNSLGIETNPLTETQIREFNESSLELGQSLGRMSDSDFSNLRITQELSREDFIKTVLEKTKDLPKSEKLKVYDYFGFELHSNETNPTGYTLTGYPANINNGVKLAKIKSEETRRVVENLRGDVVRFSENNKIKCNDPQTEKLLNQVLETLPELRTMIGRPQHGTHDFDVMQHTLKVLQKIAQEPNFEKLNESDKKVVTLAALMHDMTKTEGKTDATHATQGSFDGFFISKKFNLSREEGIKMYTLMNMHEWLSFVNKPVTDYELNNAIKEYNKEHSKSEQIKDLTPEIKERLCQEILTKRLQSVAFDLQQDNLFELALMFTHADLKAVKKDNYFHDSAEMPSCATFDGKKRVFEAGNGQKVGHGQAADIYAERIRGYVDELKKTRPLTPVTKVPDSETIRSRITQINPDGSTNFKGVFVDKDGLIVIKFNDVEDWEALGFPKGTTTKGIKGTGKIKKEGGYIEESEFETGNFKFFAHALNYANQLSKFDSFALPDSDVLLSVTYMERPETKYRNFNTQGIGLYVQSKYVHGGGNTDAGSGTGKSIDEFKKNYIFGGKREKDRTFTADIVKRATGMSDEQYVQFYEKNKNKTWEEVEPIDGSDPVELKEKIVEAYEEVIEEQKEQQRKYNAIEERTNTDPVEFRNNLIKAYAEGIVSNERGDRAYDEYYVTNPEEPMFAWVYASDKNEKIGANPLEFLHRNNKTDKESKIGRIGHTTIRPVEERTQFLREYCLNRNKVMIVFGD